MKGPLEGALLHLQKGGVSIAPSLKRGLGYLALDPDGTVLSFVRFLAKARTPFLWITSDQPPASPDGGDVLRVTTIRGIGNADPRRLQDSYFLRAESYFNVASEIEALDSEPRGGPKIINSYGGKSLHEQSHGESFFALFMNRLRGDGLYIFDEPEAALSPSRQLSFLSRMHELVGQGSQFLIATHSPILMAYPYASIFLMADAPPQLIAYRDTEHFTVTRNFLTRTDKMLDVLLDR